MDTRWQTAARVANMLFEPLISNHDRTLIMLDLEMQILTEPVWMGAWLSGLTHSIMQSLPPLDPWRHLYAQLGSFSFGDPRFVQDGRRHETPAGSKPFEWVCGSRGSFGSAADHQDLVLPDWPGDDRLADSGRAGSHDSLPVGAATMLATAGHSWRDTFFVWWLLYRHSNVGSPRPDTRDQPGTPLGARGPALPETRVDVLNAIIAALSAALFRRRVYLDGLSDLEFIVVAHDGFRHCDTIANNVAPDLLDRAVVRADWRRLLTPLPAFDAWGWPTADRLTDTMYDDFRFR